MEKSVKLLHSVHRSKVSDALGNGVKAASTFDALGLEMRRGVVYCWLRKQDDKMWGKRDDYVYLEVTVDEDRCRIADMDFISLALMYRQGSGGKPKNEEAARLLAEVYRSTSVRFSKYVPGMFWTPEVLVKGDIAPDWVRLIPQAV